MRQVRIKQANNREPSFKRRNYKDDIETRSVMLTWDAELIENLFIGWAVSGVEMARA